MILAKRTGRLGSVVRQNAYSSSGWSGSGGAFFTTTTTTDFFGFVEEEEEASLRDFDDASSSFSMVLYHQRWGFVG